MHCVVCCTMAIYYFANEAANYCDWRFHVCLFARPSRCEPHIQLRVVHGSILCDPTQPNPSAD